MGSASACELAAQLGGVGGVASLCHRDQSVLRDVLFFGNNFQNSFKSVAAGVSSKNPN